MSRKKSANPTEGEVLDDKELESLPSDLQHKLAMTINSHWSGPLPPPEVFKQYPVKVQDAIVAQAESQMKHRQSIEKSVVNSNIKNSSKGMNYAFWLTVAMLAAGTVLIALGQSVAGLVAIFGTSGFQAGNYLYQKWNEMREVGKKSKDTELETTENE